MRLSLQEWMDREEFEGINDLMESLDLTDSVVPALCSEGCEVEPDGHCQHGGESIMLALGVI